MPHVLSFSNEAATRLIATGGKGANLARLAQSGRFRVPGGFVVTTKAFRAHTEALREDVAVLEALDAGDADALREAAAALRERITERALPAEVQEAVREALAEGARYAVRSSATAEDLPSASFAGQHDTFLGARGAEAVLEKVKACMASLFTERAVAYRGRNDIPQNEVEMAVVVQEMVDAQAAGVLFTADPDTGKRTVAAVDATFGLGDPVVAGTVSADHARLDKQTGAVLGYEIGEKADTLASTDGGTATSETPAERRRERALSDAQLRTLTRLGVEVEAFFDGVPQDIEWALTRGEDGEETFALLQSRPITTLTPPPEPAPADGRLHVYMSMGHGQAMTDPMPPLALDLWAAIAARMMKDMFGFETALFARTEGRLYVDLTPLLGIGPARRSVAATLSQVSEEAAEGAARLFEERAVDLGGGGFSLSKLGTGLRAVPGTLPAVAQFVGSALRGALQPFLEDAEAGASGFREWLRQWGHEAEAQILAPSRPRALAERAFDGVPGDGPMSEMKAEAMRVFNGPVAGALLGALLPGEAERIAAAGRGHAEEVGTRMTLMLGDLADAAREAPAVEEAVREGRSLDEIRDAEGSGPFVEQLEAFLDEFGHRAAGEFDLSRPRWRENPAEPLGIVRGILRGEEKGAHRRRLREREAEAEDAMRTLRRTARRGPLGALRGPLAGRLLRVYRTNLPLRDEPKHHAAHLFAAWHEALQRVGRHLAGEGVLETAGDVWYLREEELFALLDDRESNAPDDLTERIDARRAEHERQKRRTVPPLITSEGEAPRAERGDLPEGALAGTGVSGGTVEGTARIVHSPGEATLEAGDILVCPASDPAWTPLFATAGGLVTEVGGRFTHGALVAREYGLPAVASVAGATKKIRDGQRVRVDGTRGVVEVLPDDGGPQTADGGGRVAAGASAG